MSRLLLVLWAGAVMSGCGTAGVCPKSEDLFGLDGGAARCFDSVDCPRQSNVLVCTNTSDRYRDCVDCVASRCVRFRPGTCP